MTLLVINTGAFARPAPITAMMMKPREIFRTPDYDGVGWYMRIIPAGIIGNASVIKENHARNNIVVVDLSTGDFKILKGDTPVLRANNAVLQASL